MKYTVSLRWDGNPNMDNWNEICIWAIENFGLPGDKYSTELNEKAMCWHFKDPYDQMLMALVWGNDPNALVLLDK